MEGPTNFDELIAELERDYPEEMEDARIWAKEFIERWKSDTSLVEITRLDAQTALDMLDSPEPPTEELIKLMGLK